MWKPAGVLKSATDPQSERNGRFKCPTTRTEEQNEFLLKNQQWVWKDNDTWRPQRIIKMKETDASTQMLGWTGWLTGSCKVGW